MKNEKQVEETLESEHASLQLCNLTSKGHTLAEARAILAETSDGGKGEQPDETANLNALGLPQGSPATIEALRESLAVNGFEQHPNAKLERMVSVYRKKVLVG